MDHVAGAAHLIAVEITRRAWSQDTDEGTAKNQLCFALISNGKMTVTAVSLHHRLVINSANIPGIKAVSAGYRICFVGKTACRHAEIVIKSCLIYMTLPFSHCVVTEEHTIQAINR